MEKNQQILEEINRLEQQIDLYAKDNWEFFRKVMIECIVMANFLNYVDIKKNNLPYLENISSIFCTKFAKKSIDRNNVDDALNIYYNNLKSIFLNQKKIYPNITDEDQVFQKTLDIVIEKYINFFYEHFKLKYTYLDLQGTTDLSLHFEFNDDNAKYPNTLSESDYNRNKTVNSQKRRFMSNLQIAAFYDRRLLKAKTLPNEKVLLYWIAFDNLLPLDNDKKTNLAQLLNTDDSSLNDKETELKRKILDDDNFKNNIITHFKKSFQEWPNNDITEITLENVNNNRPNKNHVVYILHAPEENLTKLEKQFKIIFLANPIQEIYAQFYKNFHNADEVPDDELLTEDQINSIVSKSLKIQRLSYGEYKIAYLAKTFLKDLQSNIINNMEIHHRLLEWFEFPQNMLTINEKNTYINNIIINHANLSEKNKKGIDRINEIKKLTSLYDSEKQLKDDATLNDGEKKALIDLYDLCFKGTNEQLSKIDEAEKIKSLKYVKESDDYFKEYIDKPIISEDIKNFIEYTQRLEYDTEWGLTKKFNELPDSKSDDISQELQTLIKNSYPKLFLNEELNTTEKLNAEKLNAELENLFKNVFDEIKEQYIPFKKWRTKHQKKFINKKIWPKILGIIAGITLGVLGIGIALATGGIGTAILGMIGTIIASHTSIFATIASIGIAIGTFLTVIFSKKINEAKSVNSIIKPKSENIYEQVDSNNRDFNDPLTERLNDITITK